MKNEKNTVKVNDAKKVNAICALFPCGNTTCPLDNGGMCSTCQMNPANKR